MKIHLFQIFFIFLFGFYYNQTKEIPPVNKGVGNCKNEIIVSDSAKIVKEYSLQLNINTKEDTIHFFHIRDGIHFDFFQLNGNNYFYPKVILSGGRSSKYSWNKFQKVIIEKDSNDKIQFEIEFCLRILKNKSKEDSQMVFLTNSKIKKEIKSMLDNDSLNTVTILSKNYLKNSEFKNTICRKFLFKKMNSNIIVEKGELVNKIETNDLIKYGEIEVIESGNILDTLEIEQKIWNKIDQRF